MIKGSKASGWFLLVFGVGIILWTLYSSYNIFNAKTEVPEVFKIQEKMEKTEPIKKIPQAQIEQMIEKQIKGLLPIEALFRLLNLISWSIFASIMIFGGGKVATLGIQLIR